ncbi:MAG TPA: YkgJ family cysteine cluster protein [Phnomibacter sp.]|nr:YkgJ family cysteine cluster protein [Phnomibacter sp.]
MKLSSLKKKYQKNKKPFRKFIKKLESSDVSDIMDVAKEMEKEVWEEVDCLSCANCCKKMTPTLTKKDKQRIAEHLDIPVKAFKEKYLVYDKDEKDWRMQQQPCVFLNLETNKCNIYEFRPDDCRGFPHLVKEPMESYAYIHKQNIKYCPATYLWVEKMMDQVNFSKK